MYCIHCGKTIDDDSIFCEYCGGRVVFNVDKELTAKMIRMKCSQCNSEMEIQENELIGGMQVLVCPYCGTRAMVVQDDEVLQSKHRGIRSLISGIPLHRSASFPETS